MKFNTRESEQVSTFSPGDIVKNMGNGDKDLGVLISRCDNHDEYWSVLTSDDVVTWFEPNIQKVLIENVGNSKSVN